jgi:hypothetical protein
MAIFMSMVCAEVDRRSTTKGTARTGDNIGVAGGDPFIHDISNRKYAV